MDAHNSMDWEQVELVIQVVQVVIIVAVQLVRVSSVQIPVQKEEKSLKLHTNAVHVSKLFSIVAY